MNIKKENKLDIVKPNYLSERSISSQIEGFDSITAISLSLSLSVSMVGALAVPSRGEKNNNRGYARVTCNAYDPF